MDWKTLIKLQYDMITVEPDGSIVERWIEWDGNKPTFKKSADKN